MNGCACTAATPCEANKRRSDLAIFVGQFNSLPVGLLGVSAVISVMTGGTLDAAVILGVVMINSVIGFVTERQAETHHRLARRHRREDRAGAARRRGP